MRRLLLARDSSQKYQSELSSLIAAGHGCTSLINRTCVYHIAPFTLLRPTCFSHGVYIIRAQLLQDSGQIFLEKLPWGGFLRQTAFLTALVLILPSLPTHSRFLLALVSTFVDPGGLHGKVTQSFILDRPESLVTLIVRGHGCYTSIYPTTIHLLLKRSTRIPHGGQSCAKIFFSPRLCNKSYFLLVIRVQLPPSNA